MQKKKKKINKSKFKYLNFNDSNYKFSYKILNCEIKKLHPLIEIKRYEIINDIKYKLFNLLNTHIPVDKLRSNTKNLKQLSNEFIIRYIFLGISENKNSIDPLFPYKFILLLMIMIFL